MNPSTLQLARQYGGVWSEHPQYAVDKWREAVNNNSTRLGYWEWVRAEIESDARAMAALVGANPASQEKIFLILTQAGQQYGHLEGVRRNSTVLQNALKARVVNHDMVRCVLAVLATELDNQPRAQALIDEIDAVLGLKL